MVGKLILEYREREGISQEELAKRLKCSTGMVSHIETGKRPITPEKAVKWEPILGISRAELCPEIFHDVAA